ncbi:hypothetical protein JXA84_06295 [candidate division WOR-3 bacterium]|nr:hypothetical protein [candidate division WOR-3 bacterium]
MINGGVFLPKNNFKTANYEEAGFFSKFPVGVLLPFILLIVFFVGSVFFIDVIPRSVFPFVRLAVKAGLFLTLVSVIFSVHVQFKKNLVYKLMAAGAVISVFAYLFYKFLR